MRKSGADVSPISPTIIGDTGPPRGEIVDRCRPACEPVLPEPAEIDLRLRAALAGTGVRDAAAKLAAETGLPRSDLYRRALAIRDGER